MENGFIIESNWNSLNNKDIKSAINIKYNKNDTKEWNFLYEKRVRIEVLRGPFIEKKITRKNLNFILKLQEQTDLDEIVSEENAIFLECETSSICEVSLKVDFNHSIQNFTIVTDCPKLELFQGKQQEYVNTYFGDILDDFEGIRVYRFDVTINQPNVCELVIKLFPGIRQIWIYGMLVVLQQSLRPALQTMSKINFENVQEMLSNSNLKLSSGAEKFLQNYMANKASAIPPNIETLDSIAKACMSHSVPSLNLANLTITDNANCEKSFATNENLVDQRKVSVSNESSEHGENIKTYLDERLKELETQINQRLVQMELRQVKAMQQMFSCMEDAVSARLTQIENSQNTKLNRILDILENKTNS